MISHRVPDFEIRIDNITINDYSYLDFQFLIRGRPIDLQEWWRYGIVVVVP